MYEEKTALEIKYAQLEKEHMLSLCDHAYLFVEDCLPVNQREVTNHLVNVYNTGGDKIHSLLIDMDYSDIVFSKDQIIIYNDMDCRICNINGVDRFTGTFEKPVSLLIPTSSAYKYTAVTSSSVDTMELK